MIGTGSRCRKRAIGVGGVLGSIIGGVSAPKKAIKYVLVRKHEGNIFTGTNNIHQVTTPIFCPL